MEREYARLRAEQITAIGKALEIEQGPKKGYTFAAFTVAPENELAYKCISAWTASLREGLPESGLYLVGPYGVGKTHLLYALARNALAFGHTVAYVVEPDLMELMFAGMKGDEESGKKGHALLQQARYADITLWDDAGASPISNGLEWYRNSVWYPWLNHRSMNGRPVFVGTNLRPEDLLKQVGGRNMDRLKQVIDMDLLCVFQGRSQRKAGLRWWLSRRKEE